MIEEQESIGGHSYPKQDWSQLSVEYADLLPDYPGPAILPIYRVPAPPLLQLTDDKKALNDTVQALRAAVQAKYKKPWFALRGGSYGKHQSVLCDLVLELWNRRIAPMAWFSFSIDAWRLVNPKGKDVIPSLRFFLDAQRVKEQHHWFDKDRNSYEGGGVWVAPAHNQLILMWQAMQQEIMSKWLLDAPSVEMIVDKHFPKNSYNVLIDRALEQYKETRDMMDRQIRRGVCIW